MTTARVKKAKVETKGKKQINKFVAYHWEGRSYTLDLTRNKVYQNWMAVETNRGHQIIGAYRLQNTAAAV